MNRRIATLGLPLALTALVLTGCGGTDTPQETASPSTSAASPSVSSSATKTPSETPSNSPAATTEPTATPELEQTAAPERPEAPAQTQAPAAAGENEVQQFFQTGGQCISDVWSSSMPYTDALHQKVIDYCAANQLGDWANGVDPMDPKNYGTPPRHAAEKSAPEREADIEQCKSLDVATAPSSAIQYCYNEFGIDVSGIPSADPNDPQGVAGPSGP